MIELSDYLNKEGLESMSFDERDERIKKLLGPKAYEHYERLADRVYTCPHHDACQDLYKFIATNKFDALFMAPSRQEAEALIPFIVENGVKGKKTIVDVGCCTGVKTVYYALVNPEAKITAIDFSQPLLDIAEEKAKKYGVQIDFINANLWDRERFRELQGRQFDSVICTNMISEGGVAFYGLDIIYNEMLNEKTQSLAAFIVPGGQLVLSCNPYDPEDYKKILSKHLKSVGFNSIRSKIIDFTYSAKEKEDEDSQNLTLICRKI